MRNNLTWLIVGGCPRSGTTALAAELAKSNSISLFHEISTHTVFRAVRDLFAEEERHRGYGYGFELYRDQMPVESRDAAPVLSSIFRSVTGRRTPIIGTKFPNHYHQPRPQPLSGVAMREIVILRDPFSTVLSAMKKLTSEGRGDPAEAYETALCDWVASWNYCVQRRDDRALRVLLYEAVPHDARRYAQDIADWLGIHRDFDLSGFEIRSTDPHQEGFDEQGWQAFRNDLAAIVPTDDWLQWAVDGLKERKIVALPTAQIYGDPLVKTVPTAQTQLDVFAGHWAYQIPIQGTKSGAGQTFFHKHYAVHLAEEVFGGIRGMSCLELGPNEGEVSFHLHHAGCKSVYSIEARARSFLKCLVVKNMLELHSVKFALGDFIQFLADDNAPHFDIAFVCGVLYHMTDPVALIRNVCKHADRVVVATHYFAPQALNLDPTKDTSGLKPAKWRFTQPEGESREISGFSALHFPYRYADEGNDQQLAAHREFGHGGVEDTAAMLGLDGILGAFRHFGFEIVGDVLDHPDAPRGPHVIFAAQRAT